MSILDTAKRVTETSVAQMKDISWEAIVEQNTPVIVRNAVTDWPIVQAGLTSSSAAMEYVRKFDSGQLLTLYTLAPEQKGMPFYNDDLTAMNYAASRVNFDDFTDRMEETFSSDNSMAYYVGSTDVHRYFPGFLTDNSLPNDIPIFKAAPPMVSLWMGGRTVAKAHWDMSNNIALCLVGKRRFILFSPEQIHNLYPGPLSPTPGGQVLSMVDIHNPDLTRYPEYEKALDHVQIADLEPGDMLLYPALWWHQVEAKSEFNIMMNYWWNSVASYADSPMNTILHAMLSLRDRPASEKQAWKAFFEYYVFGDATKPASHLPIHAQGPLAPMDEMTARHLRAQLLQKLNR